MKNRNAELETAELGFEVALEDLAKPALPMKPASLMIRLFRTSLFCSKTLFQLFFRFYSKSEVEKDLRIDFENFEVNEATKRFSLDNHSPLYFLYFDVNEAADLRLDVGCGTNPQGDVNCDLFIKDVGHRGGDESGKDQTISKMAAKNFVLCDVQHLPFKTEAFAETFSSHVIEHVDEPFRLFAEMMRVSKQKVTIICPNGLGDRLNRFHRSAFHKQFLNKNWFFKAAGKFQCRTNVNYSRYLKIPHAFMPFIRYPLEISAIVTKDSAN